MDKTSLSLSILEEIQALGSGSKVMLNNATYVKLKGLMSNAPFEDPIKSIGIKDINLQLSSHIPNGDIYFFNADKLSGLKLPTKISIEHNGHAQELMPTAMAAQAAKLEKQQQMEKSLSALDTQLMKASANAFAQELQVEMKAKIASLVKKDLSGVKVVPHMVFDDASIEAGNPDDKLFSTQVNDTVPQESGLKASLNDAVRQNKRLAQENAELKAEVSKLRAHHAACTSKPPKESDVLSTRFGNIASNL